MFGDSSIHQRGHNGTLFPNCTHRVNDVDVPIVLLGDASLVSSSHMVNETIRRTQRNNTGTGCLQPQAKQGTDDHRESFGPSQGEMAVLDEKGRL